MHRVWGAHGGVVRACVGEGGRAHWECCARIALWVYGHKLSALGRKLVSHHCYIAKVKLALTDKFAYLLGYQLFGKKLIFKLLVSSKNS